MYELKNGILYVNNIPQFGLGQSYYPSYHPQKVPVPVEGDRLGEMKKDLRDMRDAGFTLVRVAAIGDIALDKEQNLTMSFPLIKSILEEAAALEMGSMVRLQGYSIDLHNRPDATMLDQAGNEMPFYWSWFVRNCLNHKEILTDNELVTQASAQYFGRFKDMIGFQIYNEAAYPTQGFYDYNPQTLAAYRRWLVEHRLMDEATVASYEPPHRRPYYNEDPEEWVRFRLFNTERMSGFLNHLSDVAKEGYDRAETFTCHMASPYQQGNAIRGQDYFDIASGMDIMGITHYVANWRTNFFEASMALDGAESAAAIYGKHAWLIEYNARTDCTLEEWERETYNAVGAGFKGILYYQWRADYPFADSPEPNGFGMVFNDGTKTVKYAGAVAMTRQLRSLSPYIVTAEKMRSGVGILYSQHANAYCDAIDNGSEQYAREASSRNTEYMRRIYTTLKQLGFTADMVRAVDLEKNPLAVQTLFVPAWQWLGEDEQAQIARFAQAGGNVLCYCANGDAVSPHELCSKRLSMETAGRYRIKAVMDRLGLAPVARAVCAQESLFAAPLCGNDKAGEYYTIALTNYDDFERPVQGAQLWLDSRVFCKTEHAWFITPREQQSLQPRLENGHWAIDLPTITTGGYVILHNGLFQTL